MVTRFGVPGPACEELVTVTVGPAAGAGGASVRAVATIGFSPAVDAPEKKSVIEEDAVGPVGLLEQDAPRTLRMTMLE